MSSQHSSSFDINHVFEERMQQLGRKATAQVVTGKRVHEHDSEQQEQRLTIRFVVSTCAAAAGTSRTGAASLHKCCRVCQASQLCQAPCAGRHCSLSPDPTRSFKLARAPVSTHTLLLLLRVLLWRCRGMGLEKAGCPYLTS